MVIEEVLVNAGLLLLGENPGEVAVGWANCTGTARELVCSA